MTASKRAHILCPEGPSTQYLRSLVPNTIKSMVFGTRNLKYWLLGPSGMRFRVHAASHKLHVRPRCVSLGLLRLDLGLCRLGLLRTEEVSVGVASLLFKPDL